MVLLERIELSTSPLPRVCSTTELQQRRKKARAIVAPRPAVKLRLRPGADSGKALPMSEPPSSPSREERLAAKLRENLRRRKAQARALSGATGGGSLPKPPDDS
jgi:hypothetical protein